MDDMMKKAKSYGGQIGGVAEGLDFPATKGDILQKAREERLPPEVMERLEKLPDKKYDNLGEVISSAVKD